MGVSIVMGVPQHGWLTRETPKLKWTISGYHDLGKPPYLSVDGVTKANFGTKLDHLKGMQLSNCPSVFHDGIFTNDIKNENPIIKSWENSIDQQIPF